MDKIYTERQVSNKSDSEIIEIIKNIKEKVSLFSLEKIREILNNQDLLWFDRLDNKYCKLIEVPLELLCLDDLHGGSQRGIKLKNSDKIKSDESIKRISSLSQIVGSLLSEIPIIVRKYNGLFEVILGNHRAMCLINRGENNCKVLLIQDKEGADSISGADFL